MLKRWPCATNNWTVSAATISGIRMLQRRRACSPNTHHSTTVLFGPGFRSGEAAESVGHRGIRQRGVAAHQQLLPHAPGAPDHQVRAGNGRQALEVHFIEEPVVGLLRNAYQISSALEGPQWLITFGAESAMLNAKRIPGRPAPQSPAGMLSWGDDDDELKH